MYVNCSDFYRVYFLIAVFFSLITVIGLSLFFNLPIHTSRCFSVGGGGGGGGAVLRVHLRYSNISKSQIKIFLNYFSRLVYIFLYELKFTNCLLSQERGLSGCSAAGLFEWCNICSIETITKHQSVHKDTKTLDERYDFWREMISF